MSDKDVTLEQKIESVLYCLDIKYSGDIAKEIINVIQDHCLEVAEKEMKNAAS